MHFPVNAVLAGRRGNPPEPSIGLPPLAVPADNPMTPEKVELMLDRLIEDLLSNP